MSVLGTQDPVTEVSSVPLTPKAGTSSLLHMRMEMDYFLTCSVLFRVLHDGQSQISSQISYFILIWGKFMVFKSTL
jgi:hypothetical protein